MGWSLQWYPLIVSLSLGSPAVAGWCFLCALAISTTSSAWRWSGTTISSQCGLQLVFSLLGAPPQPSKRFPAYRQSPLPRSFPALWRFFPLLCPSWSSRKFSTSLKVQAKLQRALETETLDSDEAGKLRGDINWMFLHVRWSPWPVCRGLYFNSIRVAMLSRYRSLHVELSSCSFQLLPIAPREWYLWFLMAVISQGSIQMLPLRRVNCGLDGLSFPPSGQPEGGTCVVPPSVLDSWKQRTQQIFPGESLAGVGGALTSSSSLWTSWMSSGSLTMKLQSLPLFEAQTREFDVHLLAQAAQFVFHLSSARVWFEWIDTNSNPSDGLSRLGLADDWSQAQGWLFGLSLFFPEGLCLDDLFSSLEALTSLGNSGWYLSLQWVSDRCLDTFCYLTLVLS